MELNLEPKNQTKLASFLGVLDENLSYISSLFALKIHRFQYAFTSNQKNSKKALAFINHIYKRSNSQKITYLTKNFIYQEYISFCQTNFKKTMQNNTISLKQQKITLKTKSQLTFFQNITKNTLNFATGSAGSGKTFVAAVCALYFLEQKIIKKIIISRPAVEAGENLGFLPGNLTEKIDPYLRPIFDIFTQLLEKETFEFYIEKNIIELAPLAFMRGRTLNDSVLILDEAQNTTKEQMKMFLTRIGFNSKAIVIGDISQVDLPNKNQSGLKEAICILKNIEDISFLEFKNEDVMRHKIVADIISAYYKNQNK